LYAGIGANVALRNPTDLGYLAAGCLGVGVSSADGWVLPCGVGAGWLHALPGLGGRHALGPYAGPVGHRGSDNGAARYGVGLSYMYFPKGIGNPGWVLGLTPALGRDGGRTRGRLLVNLGYQF
jgi:hypothetical protein